MVPAGHEMDEHAITTTLGMLSFVTVRSGFVLGQHEFRDLAAPADWAQLHRLGKLRMLQAASSHPLSAC